jgi:UDP:flavonoid glycosyltransferase YjiC (YdhE family)
VLPFVDGLHRHLAACDVAVVQGGLATTMALCAARRPFDVRHRLERHGAGRRLPFAEATPEALADAIAAEVDRPVDPLPVDLGGAARAAALIAELV